MAALPACPLGTLANLLRVLPLAATIERAVTDARGDPARRRRSFSRSPMASCAAGSESCAGRSSREPARRSASGRRSGPGPGTSRRPRDVRGSATEEFSETLRTETTQAKPKKAKKKKLTGRLYEEQWPTYGYDVAAHAPRPGGAAAASVPRPLEAEGARRHRVPALGRLRQGLRRAAEGPLLRGQRANGAGRLDEALPALRRRLADDRRRDRLPGRTCTSCPARSTRPARGGFVVAWNARNGKGVLARAGRLGRVVAGLSSARTSTSAPGIGISTRTVCAASAAAASLDVHGGRPDRGRAGLRGPHAVHRDEQRQRLRRRRQDRAAALARDLVRALRAARVLLRHADGCLRARLHRERGRDGLRLRRHDRPPALGARGRDVRLHGGRGLAEDGVRRHLGRDVHRARRAHRGAALALQRSVGDHGRADGPRRPRLLLDLREVRSRWAPAAREDRPSAQRLR